MTREQLSLLVSRSESVCVTISLKTHRTFPDNNNDTITLKNLCSEAERRLLDEFDKRQVTGIIEKLKGLPDEIDANYNLDSLHIFISDSVKEVIKLAEPVHENKVHIGNSFAVRPLIKAYNSGGMYYVLLLSQGGVQLFTAVHNQIQSEIKNEDFPFKENQHYTTDKAKISDSAAADDLVREFLNKVDKALIKVYLKQPATIAVICTEDNYSRLLQVADRPEIYNGFVPINYNQTENHHIAEQAWDFICKIQSVEIEKSVEQLKEAVGKGQVSSDLQEVFRAAKEGRGDVLFVQNNFSQAVVLQGNDSFKLVDDATEPDAIDDIISTIAWEVFSKKGSIVFTDKGLEDFGGVALKLRYS